MKHATKKLLSLLLVAMVLIGIFAVTTHADEYATITPENDPLIYTLNQKYDGTVEAQVTGWDAPQKDIFIPKTVQGYPVTEIRGAFQWDDTLETVTFEDDSNVMWIDTSFVGCSNLKEIHWGSNPALVEIYKSFSECVALEELTIPNTVEFIGRHSFRDCYNLKSLTFEEGSRLEKIAYFAFSFSFDWDEEILPATISELTLPASLKHLDGSAFQGIPVEHFALEDNSQLIEIPDGFLAADGDLAKPGVNTDAWGFWDYVLDLFEYIGESIGRTPEAVAKACNTLLTVDLGENNALTRIGMGAFKNQTHLTDIDFGTGENDLEIARGAFGGVGNNAWLVEQGEDELLNEGIDLVLPANVAQIHGSAFDAARIKSLVISDNSKLQAIDDGFLEVAGTGNNARPGNGYVDGAMGFIQDSVQIASNCLESITLGENNSIAYIGAGAFKNQSHLNAIDFGSSDADLTIGEGAFIGMNNNAYLVENGVDETLNACIETLTFPANLVQLGKGAFEYARVQNIVFSDNGKLSVIPDNFMGMTGTGNNGYPGHTGGTNGTFKQDNVQLAANCLESVSFGQNNSLGTIGKGAFKNQSHMKSIDFGTSDLDLTIAEGAFIGVGNNGYLVDQGVDEVLNEGIETLVLPANLVRLGYDYGGQFEMARIKNLVFSDNCKLSEIPSGFMGMIGIGNNGYPGQSNAGTFVRDGAQIAANSLESIDFGENNSLTWIGDGAFKNQSHLKAIDFGTSDLDLIMGSGVFIGAGNNGYLVDQGVDAELNEGIETLVLPANLVQFRNEYSTNYSGGAFEMARVKNLVFSDNCKLSEIPSGFMGMIGAGNNGYPGQTSVWNSETGTNELVFVYDSAQLAANSLESVSFGQNNSLTYIGNGAFKNQSHMKSLDFGTPVNDLSIGGGAFIGVGNNGYLVDAGVDETLNEGIDTVVLPANLVSISGGGIFEMARIKNLVFSDNCKLYEIPNSFMSIIGHGHNGYPGQYRNWSTDTVKFVRDTAQIAANSLESVDFGENNNLAKIGSGSFYNQSHLKSIDFGTPVNDLTLENGVFIGAGNNGYLVDQGVDAERNEGIDTLVFPANLVKLNYGAFETAQIKHIVFADNGKLSEIPDNFMGMIGTGCNAQTGKELLGYDEETGAPIEEFVRDSVQIFASSLESVDFGENNSLTKIWAGAFKNQAHLKSIDFGTSEKDLTLWYGAFIGVGNNGYLVEQGVDQALNSGIDTLVLPANLVELGTGGFELARIKNLVFADNCKLTTIPDGFMQVTGPNGEPREELTYAAANFLKSVDFGNNSSLEIIGSGAFTNQENLAEINFGSNSALTTLYRGVLVGLRSLKKLDLSNTALTEIAYGAFSESGLTEILLPSSLETLDEGAFQGLTDLRTLTIGDDQQLTKLTGGVFTRCEDLVLVDLLNSNITEIGDAIKENEKLSLIVFPKNLAAITWEIPELEEGQEPLTQEEINKLCTFYGCGNVNKLRFAAADPSGYTFSEGVLQFLSESGTVYVPADTTEAGIQAYKTLLTASGLSFEEGKWTLETVAAEDLEKVQAMEAIFGQLPGTEDLTLADTEAVMAAYEAYQALTEAQQSMLAETMTQELENAVSRVEELEKMREDLEKAEAVETLVGELPALKDLTISDKDAVDAAYDAYQNLTEEQKALVDADAVQDLMDAYEKLAEIEEDLAKADAVADLIDQLPDAKDLTLADKGDVMAAYDAYNKLPQAQKDLISADAVRQLTDAVKKIQELEKAEDEEKEEENKKPVVPQCDKDANCILSQFDDITVTEWYHDGIHFCVNEGIMNGMGEGKFAPNENTTRAQLVMMLYRLAGAPSVEGKTEPFTDVAETDWFYAPIVWAYENKVVNGVTATEFAPNASVTREQVAAILHRYLGTPEGTGSLLDFPDATSVSGYAVEALTWAVGEGLITGIAQADGTALLAPTGNATRAQIATILMRHLTK